MTTAQRITKEAEDYAFQVPYDGINKFVNEQKYDGYIAGAKAEYNRAQQEIANHIAVNSLLTDSDGEADLANKLYVLTKENADLKEEIKQLLSIIDDSNIIHNRFSDG